MNTLHQIWDNLRLQGYCSDKGTVHSYIEVYEEILAPYRERAVNVLEIGLFQGDSLRMWEQYFTNAKVYGIDCSETPHDGLADLRPMIAEGTHNIFILDAESISDVNRVFNGIVFDVIIEDAGHHKEQQEVIYSVFKPYLRENGIYIIEDIQDIDYNRREFETIDSKKTVEIIDRRNIKNRYDDVIVIIK